MRPKSHYRVDASNPRARAVCDRCGQHWQLQDLIWQFEWTGPRLQNLRFLVCPPCLDKPQPQLKLIILPPDPVPVLNPRVEQYTLDDSPLSAIGANPNFFQQTFGSRIGSLRGGGGLNSAFDGNAVYASSTALMLKSGPTARAIKPSWQSATDLTSTINSSFGSYVGINWQGELQPNASLLSSLQSPIITHSLSSVSIFAPTDRGFLALNPTSYVIQYSPTNTSLFAAWTTISSGTTAGTAGEVIGVTITSTMNNPLSQFHRVAFLGNGTDYVAVAQAQFSVNEIGGDGEH